MEDVKCLQAHLREVLQERLEIRVAVLQHYHVIVSTQGGVDTTLTKVSRPYGAPVVSMDLSKALALPHEEFATAVAALPIDSTPTRPDVLYALVRAKSGSLQAPSALRATYDHAFMNNKFADDALP